MDAVPCDSGCPAPGSGNKAETDMSMYPMITCRYCNVLNRTGNISYTN